jgi:carbamoyltransferase
VNQEQNPDMHKLISMFYERTGVPVLLNTSLNGKGEPICEISDQVFWLLRGTEIDCANIFGQWYDKSVDTWISGIRVS